MVKYMNGGKQLIDKIEINLKNKNTGELYPVYIDAYDTPLSRKWLTHLNQLLYDNYFLEKNYCFFGFANGERDGEYIIEQINKSIDYINNDSNIDYHIDDWYNMNNSIQNGPVGDELPGGMIIHEHFNLLHRYFEELQGTAGKGGTLSPHFLNANEEERYYIRQLNLLCHEFESWAMSKRKSMYLPEWQRPSQLMCWLNAPRFELDEADYEDFGIETLNRSLGGVYVGVNKAVGKHHWEVYQDEYKDYGRDKDHLTTIAMRSQSQASGDFDIEWANNPGEHEFMKTDLANFKEWLIHNGFDPDDKALTIGHPQCGQVDLQKSFNTENYQAIWNVLNDHLDVFSIRTSDSYNEFEYHWSDDDFIVKQIANSHPNINQSTVVPEVQKKNNDMTENTYSTVDYAENVWIKSSSNEEGNIQQDVEVDSNIMEQANILLNLNSNVSNAPATAISNEDLLTEENKVKELKRKINDLFMEYGV